MQNPTLQMQIDDGVAVITLNRPEVRNAIDDEMRQDFIAMLDQVTRDNAIRALVLTGAGKAFCAGGDIRGMRERMAALAGQVAFNGWSRQQRNAPRRGRAARPDQAHHCRGQRRGDGTGPRPGPVLRLRDGRRYGDLAMTYNLRGRIPDGGGMYFLPRRWACSAPRN